MAVNTITKEKKVKIEKKSKASSRCTKIFDIEKCIEDVNNNIREIFKLVPASENRKFAYLNYWRYKESKLLLRELKYPREYFEEYRRGTIVKVDFGVNIGSEFSQVHYAIVLNKSDNRRNRILNVIPLTSKDKNNNYNIGNVIFNNFMVSTKKYLDEFGTTIENAKNKSEKEIAEIVMELSKLNKVFDLYSANPVCSFACYKNITTISKTRIMPPLNEYDFINKTICPDETMNNIDNKVVDYYTNMEISNE